MIETIQWNGDGVVMIDQTRLPAEENYVTCRNYREVADAIRTMVVRGAPAIGVAAAMGVALGVSQASPDGLDESFDRICAELAGTRPTAVNLFWGIERMKRVYRSHRHLPFEQLRDRMVAEAKLVREEDIAINEAIGRNGAGLVPDGKTVLTTATPARSRRPATEPLSASSARPWNPARSSTSSRTKPGRFCRARALPCGSCSATASPPP
jgi:methylthioribose-1-phosphate isomerase